MGRFWMVRAGEGGYLIGDFDRENVVAIGWRDAGDFTNARTLEEMRSLLRAANPDANPGWLSNAAGMTHKFRNVLQQGDRVISYDPQRRVYLLGEICSDYRYSPGEVQDHPHVRDVRWDHRIERDALTASSKNTLGSTLTLFQPGEEVLQDLLSVVSGDGQRPVTVQEVEEEEEEFETLRRDVLSKAHEFIKDRILSLSPDDMEQVVASLLRAMGYKARVTPKGPDRGRDVIASPDGLGFQHPRIIAEVKHRPREPMGSQAIRGFVGGLREGDRGLFVSSGGYTREARYEADRASVPVTLVDLEELASLVVEHYDTFDSEGRGLIPLMRVYWPAGRSRL